MWPMWGTAVSYLIHGDSIRQVTRDHSYVEEMVAIGQMRRGSEDYNRRKNIITRALGIGREVEPDFFEVDLETGIIFCSVPMVSAICWRTSPCMKSSQEREALRKRQPFL